MATLTHGSDQPSFEDIRLSADEIKIRKITVADLFSSLRQGIDDYNAKPYSFVLLIAFYVLFALLFTLFAFGSELRYLAFPMVAGLTFIGPLVAIAFFDMSRQRERGRMLAWRESFRFIHTSSFAPILALSMLMMLLYVAWLYMAELLYFSFFGSSLPVSVADFTDQLFSTRHGGGLIFYGNFVGFLFAFAAMALSIVAFPLTLDKPVTSFTAIQVSIRAFTSNAYVMAVWGVVVVAILALGTALFLIGLAIALPILGHATWHLYRKIIEP